MAITWAPDYSRPEKFGVDQSKYQPDTDYEVMEAAQLPPVFGAARSSISWGYTDPWVGHHLKGYESIGIKERLAYHILYPNGDAQRQVNRAVKALVDNDVDPAKIVPVEDAELVHGASPLKITKKIESMLPMYQRSAHNRMPVVYTRPQWVFKNMLPNADWYGSVFWWMAAYTFTGREASESLLVANMERYCPNIPLENVIFYQTAERGKGHLYGAVSESFDYDRFRGTDEDWTKFWRLPSAPPPPGPEPMSVGLTVPAGTVVTIEEV
jgi:GH25 family lysozyme M1 (1,4-beta-N-acetylmuramidase)